MFYTSYLSALLAQAGEKIEIKLHTELFDMLNGILIKTVIIVLVALVIILFLRILFEKMVNKFVHWTMSKINKKTKSVKNNEYYEHPEFELKKKVLLTDTEKKFFTILVESLPEFYIFSQVSLNAILEVRDKQKWWEKQTFSQKHADFIVINKKLDVIAIIELDDWSHDKPHRKEKDEKRDEMLSQAGYVTLRYDCRNMPNKKAIRNDLITKVYARKNA